MVDEELAGLKLVQGKSKTPRKLARHWGDDAPTTDGRDGPGLDPRRVGRHREQGPRSRRGSRQRQPDRVRAAAEDRRRSHRGRAGQLRGSDRHDEPATRAPNRRGPPGEAGHAVASTSRDEQRLEGLFAAVVAKARVFQGGGNELTTSILRDGVETAGNHSLARLFPKFGPPTTRRGAR